MYLLTGWFAGVLPCLPTPCSATPVFFILFPGYSPSKDIEEYARKLGKTVEGGDLTLISMGQGQEGPAEAVLDRWAAVVWSQRGSAVWQVLCWCCRLQGCLNKCCCHLCRSLTVASNAANLVLCCRATRCIAQGGWVFLDNLHLMQGWIPRLERKLEVAAESAHPGFQCFFSAEPINGAPQVRPACETGHVGNGTGQRRRLG